MSKNSPELETLVQEFVDRLVTVIEADVAQRIQGVVASAFGSSPGRRGAKARAAGQPGRRPMVVSRELAAARKLQGQYLGALRGLKPADHARVKAVAHEKGLPAAIKLAHSLKQ
jgi:hypothetical protein